MNTNDSNNPQNTGTGAGSNYGTQSTGTGFGNSTGLSNESTSYNAGTGADNGTGVSNTSGASLGNVNNTTEGDDFSATAKGASVAGTAGAVVGRGIDGIQNTADHAAHAVTGQPYDSSRDTNMTGMFRDRSSAEKARVRTGDSASITEVRPAPSRGMAAKISRFGATNEIAAATA